MPTWVIITLGALATMAGLIWSSGLRDEAGNELLDEPTSRVLVALLGATATILGLVLQRTSEVRHQVKNSHRSNLRDDIDGQSAAIAGQSAAIAAVRSIAENALKAAEDAARAAEHGVRAARKASEDTAQLREDVQALRTDHTGTAADIRGIRRDIGRLADRNDRENA